jgi:hypothetical protein
MTGNENSFKARRGIRRLVALSNRPAGAAGLPEPVSWGRVGPKSQAIWRMWKWASLPGTFRYTQGKLHMQRQSYLLCAYKTQLLVAFITMGIICVGAPPYAGGQALTGVSIVREQGFGPVLNEGSSVLPHNSLAAGAVNIIVDNPRFHNIVYVGSVSGGVWVTFDA